MDEDAQDPEAPEETYAINEDSAFDKDAQDPQELKKDYSSLLVDGTLLEYLPVPCTRSRSKKMLAGQSIIMSKQMEDTDLPRKKTCIHPRVGYHTDPKADRNTCIVHDTSLHAGNDHSISDTEDDISSSSSTSWCPTSPVHISSVRHELVATKPDYTRHTRSTTVPTFAPTQVPIFPRDLCVQEQKHGTFPGEDTHSQSMDPKNIPLHDKQSLRKMHHVLFQVDLGLSLWEKIGTLCRQVSAIERNDLTYMQEGSNRKHHVWFVPIQNSITCPIVLDFGQGLLGLVPGTDRQYCFSSKKNAIRHYLLTQYLNNNCQLLSAEIAKGERFLIVEWGDKKEQIICELQVDEDVLVVKPPPNNYPFV